MMESSTQQNGIKKESANSSNGEAFQPQRERKQGKGRNEKKEPKSYYKTDIPPKQEDPPQQNATSEFLEQSPKEKHQRQNVQKQNNREKVYQPKVNQNQYSPSENNGGSQDPSENGRKRNPTKGKQGNQQREDGDKKIYQKKTKEAESSQELEQTGNERFDNSTSVDGASDLKDPHKALQVAEASRIQQVIPSGVPKEIQDKVKRVQEIVGKDVEFHVVYGALADYGYDEEKTINFFVEQKTETVSVEDSRSRSKKQGQQSSIQAQPSGANWTNIVKKGIKAPNYENDYYPRSQKNNSNGESIPTNNTQVYPTRSPVMDAIMSGTPLDPEDLVNNLSQAIANQLKMIQDQTKMLTLMQSELSSITQVGSSERETLLAEQDSLKEREQQLRDELDDVHRRMEEVEQLLEENKKKKAERINSITNNNLVASLLKKPAQKQPLLLTSKEEDGQLQHQDPKQGRRQRDNQEHEQSRPQGTIQREENEEQIRPQGRGQRDGTHEQYRSQGRGQGKYQQRRNYQQREERNVEN